MRALFCALFVGSMVVFVACSSAGKGAKASEAGGTSSTGGSQGTGGSSQGTGGTISVGGNGNGGTGGSLQPDAACASTQQQAASVPIDIFVMIDTSSSMGDNNKWPALVQALTGFVNDPANKGVGIGTQYFPHGDFAPQACSVDTYSTPVVPIAPLPGNAQAIITSLGQNEPCASCGTPTLPALAGAVQYARTWRTAHPTHTVIVLLATDGDPTTCYSTLFNVEQVASSGDTGTPEILTFVIGVGSSTTNLNGIAAAGGSHHAYIVNGGNASQFTAALAAIRGAAALSCTYQMPKPPAGQTLDPNKVNVAFTAGSGSNTNLLQVANAAACTSSGGWYYNNPANPTQIKLCPATCSTVTGDSHGQVNILLGCQTVVAPPH